jgi:hypothetical protein
MANEIKLTLTGRVANGTYKDTIQPGAVQVTQASIGGHSPVVSVGFAAAEKITFGDISTLGWVYLHNTDTANFVHWGAEATSGALIRLGRIEAGEWACFRLEPGTTLMMQASTTGAAAVLVQMKAYED